MLARAAARAGAHVTAVDVSEQRVERGRLLCRQENLDVAWLVAPLTAMPVDDAAFDGVMSLFGASYAREPRVMAAQLTRVVRPGGTIAFTAWTGFMAAVLRAAAPRTAQPERWARYETAYRHFFDFPDLDVRDAGTRWRFADVEKAADEFSGAGGDVGRQPRVLAKLRELLLAHGDSTADGFAVEAAYALIFARRP